jgi:hypothetical protein
MKQLVIGIIGAALGAFIPCASYQLSRHECTTYPYLWILVAGGFLFSSFTVYEWAKTAFGHAVKAFGFVILTEGVLVLCHTNWLAVSGLVILVVLNATATASNLLRDKTENVTVETNGIVTLGLASQPSQRNATLTRQKRNALRQRPWRERKRNAAEANNVTPIM